MAIRIRIPGTCPPPHARALYTVQGHEAGRIFHGGTCLLRGQTQYGGRKGAGCTPACTGPTPPVYVEDVMVGLVLRANEDFVLVWDPLVDAPRQFPLVPDEVFPPTATVDASPALVQLYESWQLEREIEEETRNAALKEAQRERELQAAQEAQARAHRVWVREQSALKVGGRMRVVQDPPGFTERMRKIKERNRTPSMVGTEGVCLSVNETHVFLRLTSGESRRFLREQVRNILLDGTVGLADPWLRGSGRSREV